MTTRLVTSGGEELLIDILIMRALNLALVYSVLKFGIPLSLALDLSQLSR